jgi:hypothetical protein
MSNLAGSDWMAKTLVMQAAVERDGETLRGMGFRPAFYDYATCALFLARGADGMPAAEHVLDGLPDEAVAVRADCGRVIAARATLLTGFERHGYFYTREAAWRSAQEWGCAA